MIEGRSEALLERMRREGKRSPADVFITVDAGRLNTAEEEGIFQGVSSRVLNERVPEHLRHPQGLWFGPDEAGSRHPCFQRPRKTGRNN